MLKDAAYQEALLAKRVEFVQRLKADLANTNSFAAQTVAAYSDLVDGAAREHPYNYFSVMRPEVWSLQIKCARLWHQRSSQTLLWRCIAP